MLGNIVAFLQSLPREIYVFIISILPLIELRGAVPVGAALGIPFYLNYLVAVIGNMLPVPLILLFVPKVLDFLGKFKLFRPVVEWLHKKAEKNKGKIIKSAECRVQSSVGDGAPTSRDKEANTSSDTAMPCHLPLEGEGLKKSEKMTFAAFAALMLFVAIPFPGTGAWTGGLVAALFGLPRIHSFVSIFLGVLICGAIMCLASYGVLGFLSFLV